jgi:hypothetical protein
VRGKWSEGGLHGIKSRGGGVRVAGSLTGPAPPTAKDSLQLAVFFSGDLLEEKIHGARVRNDRRGIDFQRETPPGKLGGVVLLWAGKPGLAGEAERAITRTLP